MATEEIRDRLPEDVLADAIERNTAALLTRAIVTAKSAGLARALVSAELKADIETLWDDLSKLLDFERS